MNSLWRVERRLRAATFILLAVLFVFFVLPSWMTLNRWIPSLSETFQKATGRALSIREIRTSFWSGPELQFFNVEIGGKGEERPLASIAKLRIGIQLLPLLWRQWVIREIHLVDPRFSLSRDSEREWNFEDLIRDGRDGKPGKWKVSNQASEITIRRGEIVLVDRAVREGPIHWTAKEIDAAASRFWLGREVRLRIDVVSIWRGDEAGKAARLGITGVMRGDRKTVDFKKGTADLTATLTGVDTEGRNLDEFKENLRGNLVVYFENGTLYRFKTLGRIFTLMNLRRLPDLNEKGLPYRVISGKLTIDKGRVTLHDAVIFGRDVRMIAKGKIDLPEERLDLEMGVQVFKLLDEVIQEIPIGSQLILGKDKMFIAAYFDVEGTIDDPKVKFRPLKSIKKSVLSIIERILKFPFKPRLFAKKGG